MQYQPVNLNPLVTSSLTGTAYIRPVVVDWDIRHAPRHAARVAGQVISAYHLTQLATFPGVMSLRVVSDLLSENWVITAHNPTGVTIEDVLTAIHRGLHLPLTQLEWECMSPMERGRIQSMFYARCAASRNYERTHYGGVRRMDCLLHTTMFAGLSSPMMRNNRLEVVLTLSRDFGAHIRARSHLEA